MQSATGLRRLQSAIALAIVLGFSPLAHASHYYLVDVPDDFSEADMDLFARFGVDDTQDLLHWLENPERRVAFQNMTGVSQERIAALTLFCDLLQVDGVGPSAAHLLIASGVTGAVDLASRSAAELLADVETVNMAEAITATTPTDGHIIAWIAAAAVVPVRVVY